MWKLSRVSCQSRLLPVVYMAICATSCLTQARSASRPTAVKVVTGIATTKDGKPLPHATLYFEGTPFVSTAGKELPEAHSCPERRPGECDGDRHGASG